MSSFVNHEFPIGNKEIHPDANLNMHINWTLSTGMIQQEQVEQVAPRIKNVKDGKTVMIESAEQALRENRIQEAATFYRFAEFFTSPTDKDKGKNYTKFIELFYSIKENNIVKQYDVPYEDYSLRTLQLKPVSNVKGQIVWFGGGDSIAEDFLAMAYYFVKHGYEVFIFDGPGQGEAIYKYNKPFILEWEKPVATILDYFGLDDVTLIGTSFGGWFVLRTAAFEPRVSRAIAFDIIYDYYECFLSTKGILTRTLFKALLRARMSSFMNVIIKRKMDQDIWIEWSVNFGSYVNGEKTPYGYFKKMETYNARNLEPVKITQDVLLLAGEEDHFVPPHLLERQQKDLINARSVESRLFTKEEFAELHCQVGNLKLTLNAMIDWIKRKTKEK